MNCISVYPLYPRYSENKSYAYSLPLFLLWSFKSYSVHAQGKHQWGSEFKNKGNSVPSNNPYEGGDIIISLLQVKKQGKEKLDNFL